MSMPDDAVTVAQPLRRSLREPIPEIFEAARDLSEAVEAHLAGDRARAAGLLVATNTPVLREYIESLWGGASRYVRVVARRTGPAPARVETRMPSSAEQRALHVRDGFHCRFCGIPVIRAAVRDELRRLYSEVAIWGRTNAEQHAAFQVLWVQYDHLVPHAWGGTNQPDNVVVTCAGCNYARGAYLLEEVGLANPLDFEPVTSAWDGLERVLPAGRRWAGRKSA